MDQQDQIHLDQWQQQQQQKQLLQQQFGQLLQQQQQQNKQQYVQELQQQVQNEQEQVLEQQKYNTLNLLAGKQFGQIGNQQGIFGQYYPGIYTQGGQFCIHFFTKIVF